MFLDFGFKIKGFVDVFNSIFSIYSYNCSSFFRKDIKDIKEDTSENQQSSYPHCQYLFQYSDLSI